MGMQAQQPSAMTNTPQMLAQGLKQQGMMQGNMPMSMQRQPQGGMSGAMASRLPQQPMPKGIQVR